MNRKIKQVVAFIITVIFGYFGFTIATSSVPNAPFFGLCALAPFMVCIGFWLDEYEIMRKERVLA